MIRAGGDQSDECCDLANFQQVNSSETQLCGDWCPLPICCHGNPAASSDMRVPPQLAGPGCRRSSSDAAYERAETVRAQRECRLRPHYSDPMPADASKRKQLEMKIAAAARLHSHRRDRDRDRDSGEC